MTEAEELELRLKEAESVLRLTNKAVRDQGGMTKEEARTLLKTHGRYTGLTWMFDYFPG